MGGLSPGARVELTPYRKGISCWWLAEHDGRRGTIELVTPGNVQTVVSVKLDSHGKAKPGQRLDDVPLKACKPVKETGQT